MHRKALIAIAVGSILGGAAANAAGEQPVAISSPDSQAPPVVGGANGQPITPQTSTQTWSKSSTPVAGRSSQRTQPTTAADEQIAQDQRAIAHAQDAIRDYRQDMRYDQAKIGQNQADIRADKQNILN